MELDDFKQAWQMLDRRLEQQHAFNVQIYRDSRSDKMRRGLRPLVWGQAIQLIVGLAGALFFAPIWITHWREPAMLIAGLTMHLYCIGMIVLGAMTLAQIARLDYAAPVLLIQRQLSQLRKTYAIAGACVVGLPWWFLTAPLLVVLTRGTILVFAPSVVWIQLAVGVLGLLATVWFYRWSRDPDRAVLARKIDESTVGGSLRHAQAALDEIARFEHE
ncbi:MAG TPA: serine/threonine protein kinase [Dyella sp.]|uniref:serine/threonine protein kinase n=1 Tax=Dyella sp. TaxID=1869338 RepID=UPI002F92C963